MKWAITLFPLLSACTSSYMRDADPGSPPGPNESKVVFYRHALFKRTYLFPVFEGDKLLGFPEYGSYFEILCTPGRHLFVSANFGVLWDNGDTAVDADLTAGKTYYINVYADGGVYERPDAVLEAVTNDSKEFTRVEKRIKKMQCREVDTQQAIEYTAAHKDLVEYIRKRLEETKRHAQRLKPEDGK